MRSHVITTSTHIWHCRCQIDWTQHLRLLGLKSKSQNPFDILGLSRTSDQAEVWEVWYTVRHSVTYWWWKSIHLNGRQQCDQPFANWLPNCIQMWQAWCGMVLWCKGFQGLFDTRVFQAIRCWLLCATSAIALGPGTGDPAAFRKVLWVASACLVKLVRRRTFVILVLF